MKLKIQVAAILALSLFAGGCAASRPLVDPDQQIPVEIRPTSPVVVSEAQAFRQEGEVLVSGSLKRPVRVRMPGHVDVLFLRSDGSRLDERQIKVVGLNSHRHGLQEVRFRASLDLELPEGSSAVFSYHRFPLPPFSP
jgi:hypothetical protein